MAMTHNQPIPESWPRQAFGKFDLVLLWGSSRDLFFELAFVCFWGGLDIHYGVLSPSVLKHLVGALTLNSFQISGQEHWLFPRIICLSVCLCYLPECSLVQVSKSLLNPAGREGVCLGPFPASSSSVPKKSEGSNLTPSTHCRNHHLF